MIVSWNWLAQYVLLDMPVAELERRLMMSGLNHESTSEVEGDLAIDLEVTSNRPDCLGHLGIAREVAVLWNRPLKLPPAAPREAAAKAADLSSVAIQCPDLCYRYIARIIRGVKIGPSPKWLARRLATVGLSAINNVVDVTNYVLMECGQPLHSFDLAKLRGRKIIVREGRSGETMEAIDHRVYEVGPGTCVIADAQRPVAIGGVMGGAETEVVEATTELLIESAEFAPLSIRNTARRLNLHSDSSYRFERTLDPEGVEWASRRACELILELAGGELAAGAIDVGQKPATRQPVVLRLAQLKRILGIEIDAAQVRKILTALGNVEVSASPERIEVVPPSWRRDLSREIDLVEEVGRIHGYDEIPEDVGVPMVPSSRSNEDRVLAKVRHVLTAAGLDEAISVSVVEEAASDAFSPWTNAAPLECQMPILRRADRLRRSLVPSLLGVRRTNEALSNPRIELFEIARVYLPRGAELPSEELMLAIASGGDYFAVKGIVESLVEALAPGTELEVADTEAELLDPVRSCQLRIAGQTFAYLGEASAAGLKRFDLRGPATVAEVKLGILVGIARLVPLYAELPPYPSVARDLNLVVDERVRWADLARTVAATAGKLLENLQYRDTYRDPQRLGRGKKSLLFSMDFRNPASTLTNEAVDEVRDRIVAACRAKHDAQLRT